MAAKLKQIKLRAFKVISTDINQPAKKWCELIGLALDGNNVKGRVMPLNTTNDSEKDACCFFSAIPQGDTSEIFSTMIRFKSSIDVGHISDDLFLKEKFLLSELNAKESEGHKLINNYYFMMRGPYLVSNLTKTPKQLETYLNWITKTDCFSLIPSVKRPENTKLSDLKNITFNNSFKAQTGSQKETISIKKSALAFVRDLLFNDTDRLEDLNIEDILSAKLTVNFKKPKGMSEDDFQSQYGVLLKSIEDTDDLVLKDKKNRSIKGSQIENSMTVSVETDSENRNLNEEMLKLGMRRFLSELNATTELNATNELNTQ